jgi:hypothetical protein
MKLIVDGREFPFDFSRVTLGEQRQIKRILGAPLSDFVRPDESGSPNIDMTDPDVQVAVIWLAVYPTVTVEQVEAWTFADIEIVADPGDAVEAAEAPLPSASDGSENESGSPTRTSSESDGEPAGPETRPKATPLGANGSEESGTETPPSHSGIPLSNSTTRD